MEVLFILNILFFIFITFYKIYYLSKYFRLGILNPISIAFVVSLPVIFMTVFGGPSVLLEDGLFDVWFNIALFTTNVSLLISLMVIYFTFKFSERNRFISFRLIRLIKPYNPKKSRMIVASLIFLFFFFLMFFLLTRDFGLFNWILRPRVGYQLYRMGNGHWYALSILFLSTSYTIMLVYLRKISNLFLTLVIYVSLVFFLGSKGFILFYMVFFIIILWFRKSKYFKVAIFVIPILAFILMLANFKPDRIMQIFSYFDHYVNSAKYFKAYFNNEIDLFYGKIWLTDFYKYMPRVLFPNKPFVYGFLHVNEHFWPGQAALTNTPAFGGPLFEFADFGFLGVVFFSIFNFSLIIETILLYILYKDVDFQEIRNNSNKFYLFLWLLAPAFMIFFGAIYSITLFFIIISFLSVLNRVKI